MRDPQREVARAALHAAAVADLEHQRVEEHDRVDVLQRPLLPRAGVVHDRVGDSADQIPADRARRRSRAGAPRYPGSTARAL